jgi:hypothetical protein
VRRRASGRRASCCTPTLTSTTAGRATTSLSRATRWASRAARPSSAGSTRASVRPRSLSFPSRKASSRPTCSSHFSSSTLTVRRLVRRFLVRPRVTALIELTLPPTSPCSSDTFGVGRGELVLIGNSPNGCIPPRVPRIGQFEEQLEETELRATMHAYVGRGIHSLPSDLTDAPTPSPVQAWRDDVQGGRAPRDAQPPRR